MAFYPNRDRNEELLRTAQLRADVDREEIAARQASQEYAADVGAGNIRGTGTLTKYRPVGGWTTPGPGYTAGPGGGAGGGAGAGGGGAALREVAELGAPTSYAGGAGAPEPIGVIRGMRQTYAPQRAEGQQFIEGEYGSPLRAQQAYNRTQGNIATGAAMRLPDEAPPGPMTIFADESQPGGVSLRQQALDAARARYGSYIPPEGPKLEAAAAADVTGLRAANLAIAGGKQTEAAKTAREDEHTTYYKTFLGEHGDFSEPTTPKLPSDANLNRIYRKGEGLVKSGVPAAEAWKSIQPDLMDHFYNDKNIDLALKRIAARTNQPVTRQWELQAKSGTPEAKAILYPEILRALRTKQWYE